MAKKDILDEGKIWNYYLHARDAFFDILDRLKPFNQSLEAIRSRGIGNMYLNLKWLYSSNERLRRYYSQ